MTTRTEIRFLLNDDEVTLTDVSSRDMLLDHLRIAHRLTGTKEGCAEGDCGACTVLVGRLENGGLRYDVVNACIRFLATLHRCHVVTIEHLHGADGGLHPVQRAMIEHHGSQCGFCTPGIVMALYALWMETPDPDVDRIESALQGNLCRCTGYAPIIRAAMAMSDHGDPADDPLVTRRDATIARLTAMAHGERIEIGRDGDRMILPANADDLAAILEADPQATIVAGATDAGLWVTKFLRDISPVVFIGHLTELRRIDVTGDAIILGAGVSYAGAAETLCTEFPHLRAYWDRIAGWQIRSMGTIGGNIANGSPIGDTPPVLIALGARVVLRRGDARRDLPLEDYFLDYGRQDLAPGEFVERIEIPRHRAGQRHAAYKISKRRDEDISAVAMGMAITVEEGTITTARIALGGMAAVPKRAQQAERVLTGSPWTEGALMRAAETLDQDFSPLSDCRATSDYRMQVTRNLFRRFWLEQADGSAPVRLSA